ncbi:DUF3667 domain-containing protein [Pseudoalteromonas sp. T1lg65]|uniref:DUF3667 domain-containing protein n=1 Tax=Pseudoalteromonas sp. T1lg65 TaxID=2077101 RepID=UPI003F791063
MTQSCANCQAYLVPDAKYCSHCGQSTRSYQVSFFTFAKESLHELLDIDGRLWLTLRTVLLKPGVASYEFSQGKRNKYTPPLRLYLVISVVFFLFFNSFQAVYNSGQTLSESTVSLYSKAMFLLFPMFALYTKCFFRKSYFISNVVLSMHIHSVFYLALMILAPLEAVESKHSAYVALQVPFILYLLWYFVYAFKTMYRQSWLMTIMKTSVIYILYMATLGVVFDSVIP